MTNKEMMDGLYMNAETVWSVLGFHGGDSTEVVYEGTEYTILVEDKIILDEVQRRLEISEWHTGTPTEEGDYLVAVKYPNLVGVEYELNRYLTEPYNSFIWELKGEDGEVVGWQKIEPYEEEN